MTERKPRTVKKPQMAIELDGTRVHFIIECEDHYAAIEPYDRSTAEAKAGAMDLTVITERARDDGEREDKP